MLTPEEQEQALVLLNNARRLANQTVRDSREVDQHHRAMDAFLFKKPGDDPKERWDAPHMVEFRDYQARMFGWSKYARPSRPGHKPRSRDELP